MPAKVKSTQRNKAAKPRRAAMPASQANVDMRAGDNAQVARRESVVGLSRAETPRPRGIEAMEKAIAKEDAKIIAKASARALRRGLH